MKESAKMFKKISEPNGKDLYSLVKKYGNSSIKKKYKDFVIYYKDTNNKKTFFKWDSKSYGVTTYSILPTIKLSKTSYKYDGKVHKPSVKVTMHNGYSLSKGADYCVSYVGNCKKVGKHTVKITVKGPVGSTVYKTFTIKSKK